MPPQYEQRLGFGLTIRQRPESCVRQVLFNTGWDDWPYASYGGTYFIVSFDHRPYAVIVNHTLGDFDHNKLRISSKRVDQFGDYAVTAKAFHKVTKPLGAAVDSDFLDVGVFSFPPDVVASSFEDEPYVVDPGTICTS